MRCFKNSVGAIVVCSALFHGTVSWAWNTDPLMNAIHEAEKNLPSRIGVAIIDTQQSTLWSYRSNERFPTNSTRKVFLCASLLSKVDQGSLHITDTVKLSQDDLVTYSPVSYAWVGGPAVSLGDLCRATVSDSDNTASNKVLQLIGGADLATGYLRSIGDSMTRVDRMQPDADANDVGDERDTTTPLAAASSLEQLILGKALTPSSMKKLRTWMKNDHVGADFLRKIIPKDWAIVDKTGTGSQGSRSVIAVLYPPLRKPIVIAFYMTETAANPAQANSAIIHIGNIFVDAIRNEKLPTP